MVTILVILTLMVLLFLLLTDYLLVPLIIQRVRPWWWFSLVGGTSRSAWWDCYCLGRVTSRSPRVVLFAVKGFLRGASVEVTRAWILLRGRGVLGTGPGDPGNPRFPTHSCGSCGGAMLSMALRVSAGDMYSGERSCGQFMMRARSFLKRAPWSGFVKKSAIISSVGQCRTLTHHCAIWSVM